MHTELSKYKNIHNGKRAFIIGNGPSLRKEDLDKLYCHGEICFGANKIFKIYGQTEWKADYYMMTDQRMIEECWNEIDDIKETVFWGDEYVVRKKKENINYVHMKRENYYPNLPLFPRI